MLWLLRRKQNNCISRKYCPIVLKVFQAKSHDREMKKQKLPALFTIKMKCNSKFRTTGKVTYSGNKAMFMKLKIALGYVA